MYFRVNFLVPYKVEFKGLGCFLCVDHTLIFSQPIKVSKLRNGNLEYGKQKSHNSNIVRKNIKP